jgi:hypothetical protein
MPSDRDGLRRPAEQGGGCLLAGLVFCGALLAQGAPPLPGDTAAEKGKQGGVPTPAVMEVEACALPAFRNLSRITHTHSGIPGDPLNVALVGTECQVVEALLQAGWHPADPIALRSCLRIAVSTVFHRPYPDAPVSDLYLWGRKQDLALEQPAGEDARRRHHVRLWMSGEFDADGRPLWVGSATFDNRVEISHTTHLLTHHIAHKIDAERDKLIDDLLRAGRIERFCWIDHFQAKPDGHNGGGDPYQTDERLAVGVLVRPSASGRR